MAALAEKKIMFYVDPTWRKPGQHSALLYPFWGYLSSDSSPYKKAALEQYPFDTSCYDITDKLEEADAILMPFSDDVAARHFPTLMSECIALSKKSGLHLVIDGMGHIETPFSLPNTSIIRYGGFRFEHNPFEITVTPIADDLLERYCGGKLTLRHKSLRAKIGFAGWATFGSASLLLKAIIKALPIWFSGIFDARQRTKMKGIFFREKAVKILKTSALIDAEVLVRPSYSGHTKTVHGDMTTVRKEFVDNIDHCDYSLEVRGSSNASTRLGEILSMGRIPVILDTERNLPYADELDYQAFSFIVDFRDLAQLPQLVSEFHKNLSDEEFVGMQRAAREAFLSHVRPDKLTPYIIRRIRQNINKNHGTT